MTFHHLTLLLMLLFASVSFAAPFVPERDAQCVAWSADGTLVATGKSGMSNGKFPPRPHPNPRKCAAVEIWQTATGKKIRRMETYGDLVKLAFSPDGQQLAAARLFSPGDSLQLDEVTVWDVPTGVLLQSLDRCHSFDFSPAGKSLAVLSLSRCVVYDMSDWTKVRQVKPLGKSFSVAYSPRGDVLAGVSPIDNSEPTGEARIRLCHAATGELLRESPPVGRLFYRVAFSPDGRWLATGHAGGLVVLWETDSLKVIGRLETGLKEHQHPFFSPDGRLLASGGQEVGDVTIWELPTGKELARYTFSQGKLRTYYPRVASETVTPERDPHRFVFSPDGSLFLAGCFGGIVRTVASGQEVQRFKD